MNSCDGRLRGMDDPLLVAQLSYKNICSSSTDKEKTFKHLFIFTKLLKHNQNKCNTINKQCSLDLDVAWGVYLHILNILKPTVI